MTNTTQDNSTLGDQGTCVDVNECTLLPETSRPCDGNATCTNSPGSYNCSCGDGFSGDGLRYGTGLALASPHACTHTHTLP